MIYPKKGRKAMRISHRSKAALAAFMLLAPAAGAVIAAAPVAQASPVAAAAASSAEAPALPGFVLVCTTSTCLSGTPHGFQCPSSGGVAYNSSGVTVSGKYVLNACGGRVWLDQNADGSGYSLCIKAHSATNALHRDYKRLYISGNTASC